jgi:hypothetical protein
MFMTKNQLRKFGQFQFEFCPTCSPKVPKKVEVYHNGMYISRKIGKNITNIHTKHDFFKKKSVCHAPL